MRYAYISKWTIGSRCCGVACKGCIRVGYVLCSIKFNKHEEIYLKGGYKTVLRMRIIAFSMRYNLIPGARRLCCSFFFSFLLEIETEMFRGKFFLLLAIAHHLFDVRFVVIGGRRRLGHMSLSRISIQ